MHATLLLACGLLIAAPAPADQFGPRLVLIEHSVDMDILGIVADIVVRRTYRYEGEREATLTFSFPLSPATDLVCVAISVDSVPAALRQSVPGRTKRERSLVAADRMVPPGGTVTLDVRYTETLIRAEGAYELVYPTAAGPGLLIAVLSRDPAQDAAAAEAPPGDSPQTTASITLTGALPVEEFTCVSHEAESWFEGRSITRMLPKLDTPADRERDLVVRYRLAGDEAIPEVYTFEAPDGELMLMVGEPGKNKREAE